MSSKVAAAIGITVATVFLVASTLLINGAGAASNKEEIHFNSRFRNIGEVPKQLEKSAFVGGLPLSNEVKMLISFQLRDGAGLNKLKAELYNPASPRYHQWITAEEFGNRFGRSEAEIQTAVDWLKKQGFYVDRTYSNRLAIGFSGTVETVQHAFSVQMGEYIDPVTNRTFYSNAQPAVLPSKLAAFTVGLTGLNNAVIYHRPIRSITKAAAAAGHTAKSGGGHIRPDGTLDGQLFMGPKDFATAYNFAPLSSANVQGQGETIGIIMDSDVLDSDMSSYRNQFGLPAANLQRVVLPGLSNPGVTQDGELEADLDTQAISGVAPLAQIDLFTIPQLDSLSVETAEEDIVSAQTVRIVNESFGGCEGGTFSSSEQAIFTQAATEGIAFFVAAGDSGAQCNESPGGGAEIVCPACYPDVTSVGGTEINATFDSSGNLSQKLSETVWNDPPGIETDCNGKDVGGGAGGGGISQIVSIPSYQQGTQGSTGGVPSGNMRNVPDVAALAGAPFTLVYSDGAPGLVGGTSLSSPLWAGMMVLINQFQGSAQGLPNSMLYQFGVSQYSKGGTQVFNDITSGNNSIAAIQPCLPNGTPGYSAATGYDPVSGLGAPNAFALAQAFGPGSECFITLSSTSQTFTSSGGTGSITITAGVGCSWTAASSQSWLTVTSGSGGTGPGSVGYSVSANSTSSQRTATITIGSDTYSVTQDSSGGGSGGSQTTELAVDDGNFQDAIGADAGGLQYGVNRLTPATYPATISQVKIYFASPTGVNVGDSITVLVGNNAEGGTNISGTNFQTVATTIQSLDQFNEFTVPSLTITSGDFVVGFSISAPSGVDPFVISTDPPLDQRSYVSTDGTNFFLIDNLNPPFPGNFGIRAEVTEGSPGGGGGGGTSPAGPPVVSNLSADLQGNVLTVVGTGTDTGATMTQIDVSLLDSTNHIVDDTGAVSTNFGAGPTANFLYQFTNMASFPTAVIASVVVIDSQGNRSTPVSFNFGTGSTGGPNITSVSVSSAGMVIKGSGFSSGLELEVNGMLVAPPLAAKDKGGVKLKITGKTKNFNLSTGPNRIQLISGSLKSNIFVLTVS